MGWGGGGLGYDPSFYYAYYYKYLPLTIYLSPNHLLFLPLVTFSCYLRWFGGPQCVPLLCYIFYFADCWILNFCPQISNLATSFTCTNCFISVRTPFFLYTFSINQFAMTEVIYWLYSWISGHAILCCTLVIFPFLSSCSVVNMLDIFNQLS